MTARPDQSWLQIVAASGQPALLEAAFEAEGALAIVLRGDGSETLIEPRPGDEPTWKRTEVAALFPAGTDPDAVAEKITAVLGPRKLRWRAERVEDRDWVREWMDGYRPLAFGRRLWVCPRHAHVEAKNAVVLRLDPGAAFGTGTHATTALCLEWLDAHPPAGLAVLDYGCGSGVLALAAAHLDAASVQAVDIDPRALAVTEENSAVNGVSARLRTGPPEDADPADVVIANILSGPLIELAPRLTALVRPGGRLILSGILAEQAEAVTVAYAANFVFEAGAARDGWIRLDGRRCREDDG